MSADVRSISKILRGALSAAALSIFIGCSPDVPLPVPEPMSEAYVVRGAELTQGLAACGYCHGADATPRSPLAGGRAQNDIYGAVNAANITPARSGIGMWTNADVIRVLRAGTNLRGEALSLDVHRGYEWMSDRDTLSIIAYLRALPPQDNEVERRSIGSIELNTTGILERRNENRGFIPDIAPRYAVAYGRYLVDHVARCGVCHNQKGGLFSAERYLMGGRSIEVEGEQKVAPSISSQRDGGIGSWSEQAIVRYLREGVTADGEQRDSRFCPTEFYANASEADLKAIAAFLKSGAAS